MQSSIGVRAGGLAAMLGGLLVAAAAIVMASRPPGVPGAPRETIDLLPTTLLAILLIVGGLAGLQARQAGRAGVLGKAALAIAAGSVAAALLGTLGLAAGLLIPWWVVFLGFLGTCVGSTLAGVAALRAGVVPRPAALLLTASSPVFLVFNTEDTRALLAVPFGIAWALLGYALVTGRGAKAGPSAADAMAPVQLA